MFGERETSRGPNQGGHSYCTKLLLSMEGLRNRAQLCDVVVVTGRRRFQAHKLVLAASSSFFQSLFTLDMMERQQQEVELNNIDASVMARVIHYIYTGTLASSVTPVEARELFAAADYLFLPGLKEMAAEELRKSLSAENCLRTYDWAQRHAFSPLFLHAFHFVRRNFSRVSRTDDFLRLSPKQLRPILGSNKLSVVDEEEVYEALKRWTQHREAERQAHFAEFFNLIRLEYVSRFYLENVINADIVTLEDRQLRRELLETCDAVSGNTQAIINPLLPPRRQVAMVITVLDPDVYSYIPTTKEWLEMSSVPTPRIFSSSAMCSSMVYNIGGLADTGDSSNVVECFDPSANAWFTKASLPVPTRAAGLAVLGEFLYVVGGKSNSARFNIVQRYDPRKDNWILVTSLREPRSGTTLVSCRGNLYVIGGRRDENSFLRSIECYSPETNTWSLVAPMNVARACAAAACVDDKIYVIGGVRSPGVSHNSCEVYDVVHDQWTKIAETARPRSYAGIAVFKGSLLIFGGEDSGDFHDTIECYDIERDSWTIVDKMPKAEKFVDCCTMFMSKDLLPIFPSVEYE